MKKRNMVVANWKMNPQTLEEAKKIFGSVKKVAQKTKNIELIVCPPFLYLSHLLKQNTIKNLYFGSQNISTEEKGAYTGEISVNMIKNIGAKYSIVGHSERRTMGETNENVRKKLITIFNNRLIPILCIGEKERDGDGKYLGFLKQQLKECLYGIEKKDLFGMIIAYEPIWAIGKSYKESMNPTDVHEMTLIIKKIGGELFGKEIGDSFKILYGGSVEPENAPEILEYGNVEGFLVGHASLDPIQFSQILKSADVKR